MSDPIEVDLSDEGPDEVNEPVSDPCHSYYQKTFPETCRIARSIKEKDLAVDVLIEALCFSMGQAIYYDDQDYRIEYINKILEGKINIGS